jgi:hypothetical protein
MDKLSGSDLLLACRVTRQRYAACMQASFTRDVLAQGDAAAPTRKCGSLFATLQDFCAEHVRSGELVLPEKGSSSKQ